MPSPRSLCQFQIKKTRFESKEGENLTYRHMKELQIISNAILLAEDSKTFKETMKEAELLSQMLKPVQIYYLLKHHYSALNS